MLVSVVEICVSGVNTWGVKCDKVVDFPKSGHIRCFDIVQNPLDSLACITSAPISYLLYT